MVDEQPARVGEDEPRATERSPGTERRSTVDRQPARSRRSDVDGPAAAVEAPERPPLERRSGAGRRATDGRPDSSERRADGSDRRAGVDEAADRLVGLDETADRQAGVSETADRQAGVSETADRQAGVSETAGRRVGVGKTADRRAGVGEASGGSERAGRATDEDDAPVERSGRRASVADIGARRRADHAARGRADDDTPVGARSLSSTEDNEQSPADLAEPELERDAELDSDAGLDRDSNQDADEAADPWAGRGSEPERRDGQRRPQRHRAGTRRRTSANAPRLVEDPRNRDTSGPSLQPLRAVGRAEAPDPTELWDVDRVRPRSPAAASEPEQPEQPDWPDHDWLDQDAGPVVRPYTVTGGRARPAAGTLDLLSYVESLYAPDADTVHLQPEHRSILSLTRTALSLAEIAAHIDLPVGVVRVLIGDLVQANLVSTFSSSTPVHPPDEHILQAVIDGLRAL
jgi:hypothetical protein